MSAIGAGTAGAGRPAWPGAGGTREFARTRNAAYWLSMVLIGSGAIILGYSLITDAVAEPLTLAYAAVWAIWGLAGYAIVTRADLNWSVPGTVRLVAMLWGLLCLAYSGRLVGWSENAYPVSDQWAAAVHAPVPEEISKLLGMVLLAFVVPAVFYRPLGALTVGMLVGLGFATAENLWWTGDLVAADGAGPAWSVLLERGIYGAPWAHPLYAGIAALGVWCVVAYRRRSLLSRIVVAAAFFLLAVLMHVLQESIGVVYGQPAAIGYWAVQLVALLMLVWWARRLDGRWLRMLTRGGLAPVMDAAEAASLLTRRSRRRSREAGAAREVQKTQLRYANAVSDGDESAAEDLRHRERLLRIGTHEEPSS